MAGLPSGFSYAPGAGAAGTPTAPGFGAETQSGVLALSPALPTAEQRRNVLAAAESDLVADPVKAAACRRTYKRFSRQVRPLGFREGVLTLLAEA